MQVFFLLQNLHKPQHYFKIFPTGVKKKKKKAATLPKWRLWSFVFKIAALRLNDSAMKQWNPDTGLFVLWAYISYHLLGTTWQFVNSKGLKLVKICTLMPAPMSIDSGQNRKMHRAARVGMTCRPVNSNQDRQVSLATNLPCALFSCTSTLEMQNIVFPPEEVYPKSTLKK